MDDRRLGIAEGARRHQRGWRPVDLAGAAGVGPGVCGLLERGRAGKLSVRTARAIAAAVDLPLGWDIGWQRQDIDRLLDADHALLAASVASTLRSSGWAVRGEVSFNHYGDRGRIDLLAFHEPARILAVVEIKTIIVEAQDLLGTLDVKTRIAPTLVGSMGWERPATVIPVIVVAEGTTARRHLARLAPLLERFGLRGTAAFSWLARPTVGPTGLLILRALPSRNGVDRRRAGRRRIRVRTERPRSTEAAEARPPRAPSA